MTRRTVRDVRELAALYRQGLSSKEIGRLLSVSASTVRSWTRAAALNPYVLRAESRSVAILYPLVAAEFVRAELDGRIPAELTPGSGQRCRWRCRCCAHEWVTSVSNRCLRGSGCPHCAAEEVRRQKRAASEVASVSMATVAPGLVREFVRNVDFPWRDAYSTPAQGHDRISWRCSRGHTWETEVRQRVRLGTGCSACRPGLHRSRLEIEIAGMLEALLGVPVFVDYLVERADRNRDDHVDLYVPAYRLMIDIDHPRWHGTAASRQRDRAKTGRLGHHRFFRARPCSLGLLPGVPATQQWILDVTGLADAWAWTRSLISPLSLIIEEDDPEASVRLRMAATAFSEEERAEVLAAAALAWLELTGPPTRSLATVSPEIASEFVCCISRPGLTPTLLTPGSNERVRWRCATCQHEWEALVCNRTATRSTGCPPCSYAKGALLAATPRPGSSLADVLPMAISLFRENLTRPGRTPDQMKPNSIDRCRWACPSCGHDWIATPQTLSRGRTCSACGRKRSALAASLRARS
ncbi:MAG: zinc-ribbon domain-containing protein [Propionibacteriaceae bacterium]